MRKRIIFTPCVYDIFWPGDFSDEDDGGASHRTSDNATARVRLDTSLETIEQRIKSLVSLEAEADRSWQAERTDTNEGTIKLEIAHMGEFYKLKAEHIVPGGGEISPAPKRRKVTNLGRAVESAINIGKLESDKTESHFEFRLANRSLTGSKALDETFAELKSTGVHEEDLASSDLESIEGSQYVMKIPTSLYRRLFQHQRVRLTVSVAMLRLDWYASWSNFAVVM